MRAFSQLLVAATMVLCTGALAQDRKDPLAPQALDPAATTGAAPSQPGAQAPVGHRQPRAKVDADAAPSGGINFGPVSPHDQEIDRNLNICRGC